MHCVAKMTKIIFHVDMDAFYASVEESLNPDYQGKPLIVGADPKKGRGVVLTANYEARKFDLYSGMPIARAYKLCPDGIYVRPNFSTYHEFSKKVIAILKKYSTKLQKVSIDEAYLDVTDIVNNFKDAEILAKRIQKEIFDELKITCSIGIAPNKLVAKIASSTNKPNKITVVTPENIKSFLHPLPVEKLHGIGSKTAARLRELGIETIGDLANFSVIELARYFGKSTAYYFHELANGIDYRDVVSESERKSISEEITFGEDTDDIDQILEEISAMATSLFEAMKKENMGFRTVTIKLRYANFETHTKSKTVSSIILDNNMLIKIAKTLFLEAYEKNRKLRLIGVRLSNFVDVSIQRTLLEFI